MLRAVDGGSSMDESAPQVLEYAPGKGRSPWEVQLIVASAFVWVAAGLLMFAPHEAPNALSIARRPGIVGTPLAPIFDQSGRHTASSGWMPTLVFWTIAMGLQWPFLISISSPHPTRIGPDRMALLPVAIVGLLVTLLIVGALATLLDIWGLWGQMTLISPVRIFHDDLRQHFGALWVFMLFVWGAATFLLAIAARRLGRQAFVARSTTILMIGAVAVVALAVVLYPDGRIPAFARHTYGAHTGLVFGITVFVSLLAPGVWSLLELGSHTAPDHGQDANWRRVMIAGAIVAFGATALALMTFLMDLIDTITARLGLWRVLSIVELLSRLSLVSAAALLARPRPHAERRRGLRVLRAVAFGGAVAGVVAHVLVTNSSGNPDGLLRKGIAVWICQSSYGLAWPAILLLIASMLESRWRELAKITATAWLVCVAVTSSTWVVIRLSASPHDPLSFLAGLRSSGVDVISVVLSILTMVLLGALWRQLSLARATDTA